MSLNSAILAPCVYEYREIKKFLDDYVIYLKQEKKMSVTRLGEIAGFASRNYVAQIIKGERRLGERFAPRLARALGLNPAETQYFLILAEHNRCRDQLSRVRLEKRIDQLSSYRKTREVNADQFEKLSKWYSTVILEFIKFAPEKWTNRDLSQSLGISEEDVVETLDNLESLELIQKSESGDWLRTGATVETPREIESNSAMEFMNAMLNKALEELQNGKDSAEAIFNGESQSKNYNCMTIALSDSQFSQLRSKIWNFLHEVNSQTPLEGEPVKIYQMNVQLFSLLDMMAR